MAETALEHGLDADPRSERFQVVVHVDAAVLADPAQPGQSVLEDGAHVSAETSRRLACEATRVKLRHGENGPPRHGAADADDPADAPAGAGGAGPRMPLPGLWSAPRPGPSRSPLGQRGRHPARQPRAAVRPASPGGPRGRLHGGPRQRRPAALQHAARPADPRSPGLPGGAARAVAGARRDEQGIRSSRSHARTGSAELGAASGWTSAGRSRGKILHPAKMQSRGTHSRQLDNPTRNTGLSRSNRSRSSGSVGAKRLAGEAPPAVRKSTTSRDHPRIPQQPCGGRSPPW